MRQKNLDLIIASAIALANMGWALLPDRSPVIGTILALPLVFVLPGYTLTQVLLRKQLLDITHRVVLSIGLSLAIIIVGGLILNFLPGGLQNITWALLLGLLTIEFSLLAMYLRQGTIVQKTRRPRLGFTLFGLMLSGLATIMGMLAIVYSAQGAAQQQYPPFTQFWMVPASQAQGRCTVQLGVRSFESASMTYRVVLTTDGVATRTWSSIILAPQGEWDQLVVVTPQISGNTYVDVRLYRLDRPEIVYRETHSTFRHCTIT